MSDLEDHQVVFLCEPGRIAERVVATAGPGKVAIDLVGAAPAGSRPRLVRPDADPETLRGHRGVLAVAHPIAIVLGELLQPLERELGIVEAVAVVLRPAAAFGDAGVEELRDQTVRLLNFSEVPIETFGRQLAFNIIPRGRHRREPPDLESRIVRNVGELLGWSENRMALKLLVAPLFHGHGIQIRVRLGGEASLDAVRRALESDPRVNLPNESDPATPLDVTGAVDTRVSDLCEDGLGGFWLWGVAGETAARAAEQAVRVARSLSGL